MTAERRFDPISIPAEGGSGRRRIHRITCSECPNTEDVSANTFGGSRAHEDLSKVLKRRGWEVGRNPARDLCPDCLAKRSRKTRTVEPMTKVVPIAPQADPPRQPTFDEKRVILLKLSEVYISETVGYDRGWSDKRVAEHLGVPWKWVEELRAANFGPVRESEDVREAIAEIKQIKEDAEKLIAHAREHLAQADKRGSAIETALQTLIDRLGKVERRMADIERGR